MKKKKNMNTYVKYILILFASLIIGAGIGIFLSFINMDGIGLGAHGVIERLRQFMFPVLIVIGIASIIVGEYTLRKNNRLGIKLQRAEDEESDSIEYEIEQIGALGMIGNTVFNVLSLVVLSTGYSLEYIDSLNSMDDRWLLAAFGVFIAENFYMGFWQIRFIKTIQTIYPEKTGDPVSGKFQKQWLESCDEAERELIYQSAYKTYLISIKVVSILTFVSLFTHLIWNTGVMAVFLLGGVWIVMTLIYCRSCVKLKADKLNT